MFKNTTRRGLAIGAALSLALTGLVASPAQANTVPFELKPSAGASYTTLVDQTFTLEAVLGSGNGANASQLKYSIVKAAGSALDATSSITATANLTEKAIAAASTSHVLSSVDADLTTRNYLRLAVDGATTASASVTVEVTAFIDINNNGVADDNEPQSKQTVTFLTYADAEATVVVSAIAEGDDELKATVSGLNFNEEQLDGALGVTFYVNGSASASGAVSVNDDLVATTSHLVAANDTVSAEVSFSTVVIAESDTVDASNKTIDTVTASAVTGNNVVDSGSGQVTARINSAFSVKVETATSASEVAVAAIAGTYKVETTATLSSTVTLKIAGVTYDDNDDLPTAAAFLTDADGEAVVELHPTGFSTSDTITVSFTAQNIKAEVLASQQVAAYSIENVDGNYAFAAPGGTVALSYEVKDQWKVLSAKADRLKITASGNAFVVDTQYVNISGGKATVNITGNPSTISGDLAVSATLEEQDSATKNWNPYSTEVKSDDVKIKFTESTPNFSTDPASDSASVSGLATISGAVSIEGAVVSITGAGLVFEDAQGNTASGAIAVRTGENGLFTVSATSDVAGEYEVTVTVGTYSEEIVITIDPVDADAGTTLTITTAAGAASDGKYYAAPGSTVQAVFTLTDDNGNPVAIATADLASFGVVVTGPGFVGTLPTTLNANGQAMVSVLLGSQDSGTLTFTATYTPNTGDDEDKVSAVLPVEVGSAPAAPAADQRLTVGSFKGFVAIYTLNYTDQRLSAKVAGRWLVVESLNRFQRVVRNTGAGFTIKVDLYIDREFVRSETIVTK